MVIKLVCVRRDMPSLFSTLLNCSEPHDGGAPGILAKFVPVTLPAASNKCMHCVTLWIVYVTSNHIFGIINNVVIVPFLAACYWAFELLWVLVCISA